MSEQPKYAVMGYISIDKPDEFQAIVLMTIGSNDSSNERQLVTAENHRSGLSRERSAGRSERYTTGDLAR